jgi:hypothetical protein
MDSLKPLSTGFQQGVTADIKPQLQEDTSPASSEPLDSVGISGEQAKRASGKKKAGSRSARVRKDVSSASKSSKAPAKGAAKGGSGREPALSSPESSYAADTTATTAMRSLARRAVCTYLGELGEKLKAGEVKGEDFHKASMALYDIIRNPQADPLVGKMARELMYTYVKGTTTVADWQLKKGPISGPTECISSLWRRLENWGDGMYLGPENGIKDFLDALQAATEGRKVPEEALKSVAHFSRAMQSRGDADFKPEIRQKEPREEDLAQADDSASLVEHWWHQGQITVRKDGREVLPGSLDIRESVKNEKVEIHGSELRLYSPSPKQPAPLRRRTKEIFDAIDSYEWKDKNGKNERDKGFAILGELARSKTDEARAVLGTFIGSLDAESERGDHQLRKLARVIKEGQNNPALKELVAEHLPTLSTLISRYNAREMLVGGNLEEEAKVAFARELTGTFPELLKDERFFNEEMGTLLTGQEINALNDTGIYMRELFEKDPSLVRPTVDIMIADKKRPYLYGQQCLLIDQAVEKYGWLPDREQAESLLTKLYQPPGQSKRSLFHSGYSDSHEFSTVLSLFSRINGEKPELIEGFELPDSKGRMVSLGEALKDRVLTDPVDDGDLMRNLLMKKGIGSGSCHWARDFCHFMLPDDKAVGDYLDAFEKTYREAGALNKLAREGKMAFAILSSLDMGPEKEKRLRDLVMPERYSNQGFYIFSDFVDDIRREEIARDMEAMRSGRLSAKNQVTTSLDGLKMAHRMGSLEVNWRSSEIFKAMDEGIRAGSLDTGKEAGRLLSKMKTELAAHGTFDKSPEKALLNFQVLEHLTQGNTALFDDVFEVLRPCLGLDQGYGNGILNGLLDSFRERAIEKMIGKLWERDTPPLARFETSAHEIPSFAALSYTLGHKWGFDETAKVFRDGMKDYPHSPEIRDIAARLKKPQNSLDIYGHLAQREKDDEGIGGAWIRFRDVLDHTGGESHYATAKNFYDYIEDETARGRDRERCLMHCMRAYSLGQDPRNTPWIDDTMPTGDAGVDKSDQDSISIGGIRLEVHDD